MFEARLRMVVKFFACLDAVKKLGLTPKWVCLEFVGYFT
jgi:hypothetical protein